MSSGSDRSERQTSGRDACIRALQAVMAAHPLTARRTTSAQTAALVSAASLAGVLVGLIGRGIQQSRTPMMHEREAARLGLDCAYILVDFDALRLPDAALPDILAAGAALGFQGFNVTHPFKQQILPHLDALSPEAAAIGAVNTVVYAGAGATTTGHNTDCWGFAESFRAGLSDVPLRQVVQFGAGGAGAAVAYALMQLGVERLEIVDTDPARAQALAAHMRRDWGERVQAGAGTAETRESLLESLLGWTDGIVNTTPVGMAKYPGTPFPAALLRRHHWVAEIVYFPQETELLRAARALGCRTLAGTGMAIGQAVRAFELFTGRKSDMAAMATHFAAAA
ncbi:MAG: shikimate dehydrogenase [Ferrovibrio sp.]|uniref:shikimate dehydrogenase n=1 Tax=Ferrovibrio sp. TaxID=1917215 RepID=UPI00391DFAF8